ncbi:MAG TPA: hypothetical protein PLL88_03855 [Anaerolineaceae bacterium]|nr:hypothetical protein [Anaerolineaceae bacterium]
MSESSQPLPGTPPADPNANMIDKRKLVWGIIIFLLVMAASIYGIYSLVKAGPDATSQVRDIFIIVLAFESFIIGVALVILVIQLAALTNMLQNEIKPIISNTRETIDTVKGTADFLSKRAVKPVIAANSYMAGAKKLFEILGILKK